MKKAILTIICLGAVYMASAQILPSFQFGLKGGMNFSSLSKSGTFNTSNQAGYLGGIWARVGALGFNFQPEAYITSKNVNIMDNGVTTQAKFTSVDVPLLFGGKIGAFGLGARFYTGPLVSFAINKDQSYSSAASNIVKLDYKDQNYAWQFGAGADIRKVSVDLRYEAGLSSQTYGSSSTKVNLFNLSLGYKLF
jgi:hypothetical protein